MMIRTYVGFTSNSAPCAGALEWIGGAARVLRTRMHENEKKETVSGSSSTQVLTYMRVACTDTHVMWARLPEIP